ncbi:GAF domain-containing protein [Nostoc sp. FACHB-280]|uniref:GAF domain-containing protein n=1 Tax=Nostoc sp. FACHB-280 TaxID=2692839 RepID=UPI00168B4CCF|nr:GAF domain-containing protein [Nostoc sp. FACHB-280]MBD2493608.1 GAF domain-containing protein [Nostoc sp. FACHB-280]
MQIHSHSEFDPRSNQFVEQGLRRVLERLVKTMQRDALIRQTTHELRESLQADRVVLYYFYWQWHGQVTFESLSSDKYSILGSTGADNCFTNEYADLYLAGRVRAIADTNLEPLPACHREFLHSIQVCANLVVPILVPKGLWGLLVAHQCQTPRIWSPADINLVQTAAKTLATDANILGS